MKVVEKHSLLLRLVHWLNVPLLSLMIWSGILIYWANDEYVGFFPQWFYHVFHVEQRLAIGIATHMFVAWIFIFNGIIYLTWFFLSGHWREVLPTRSSMKKLVPTILHDMGFKLEKPPQGKFNAAQRVAYTSALCLGIIGVLSGFAVYKPVQLASLATIFTGYKGARLVHFLVMISFCSFIFLHLVQVFRAGWNNFRAMIAGFEMQDEDHE